MTHEQAGKSTRIILLVTKIQDAGSGMLFPVFHRAGIRVFLKIIAEVC